MAVTATLWHGSHHFFGGRAERALDLYRETYELAREGGDRELELVGLLALLAGYMGTGRPNDLVATCERGLEMAGGDLDLGAALMGRSPAVNFIWMESYGLAMLGRMGEAQQPADEGVEKARRRGGEPENIGWTLWIRAWWMGFNEGRARVALLEALRRTDPARADAEADTHLRRIGDLIDERDLGYLRPHVAEQRGELALLDGDDAAGRAELERGPRAVRAMRRRGARAAPE